MKIGPVTYFSSDGYYRPSLWIALPHSAVVLFFGWQAPSLLWLRA